MDEYAQINFTGDPDVDHVPLTGTVDVKAARAAVARGAAKKRSQALAARKKKAATAKANGKDTEQPEQPESPAVASDPED